MPEGLTHTRADIHSLFLGPFGCNRSDRAGHHGCRRAGENLLPAGSAEQSSGRVGASPDYHHIAIRQTTCS